jgi:hypothetical protein
MNEEDHAKKTSFESINVELGLCGESFTMSATTTVSNTTWRLIRNSRNLIRLSVILRIASNAVLNSISKNWLGSDYSVELYQSLK